METDTDTHWIANVVSDSRTGAEMAEWFAGAPDEMRVAVVTDHGVSVVFGPAPDEAHAELWLMDALPDDSDDITIDDWGVCDA